jgi:DNA mismatch repair protein MutS
MEDEFDGIVNYNIAAKKKGDTIIFLRKIVRGSTDDSYGIEVAKLSGIPNEVIRRAKEVLATVEASAVNLKTSGEVKQSAAPASVEPDTMDMQEFINAQVVEELKAADLNTLSPLEAMNLLFGLQRKLKNG